MPEQQNVELVKKGYDAFARGDIDSVLALLDDEIEWSSPGPADLPTAGRRRGRAQVAEFFKATNDVFDIERFEPKQFVAQGDTVVVLGEDTSRLKATGSTHDLEWVHVFRVKAGKIVSLKEYSDLSAVALALAGARARNV